MNIVYLLIINQINNYYYQVKANIYFVFVADIAIM